MCRLSRVKTLNQQLYSLSQITIFINNKTGTMWPDNDLNVKLLYGMQSWIKICNVNSKYTVE